MLKVSAIAFSYLWTTVRIQTFSLDKPRFETTSPRFRGLIPFIENLYGFSEYIFHPIQFVR